MSQPLKILILEDNLDDAELALATLRRAGFEPEWERVDTEAAYLEKLNGGLDVVLSDYQMPEGFNGLRALELLKRSGLEVPFILVSGTIGEDTAVSAMKMGATDYFLKDRLARLGAAVTHALAESRLRREREQSAEALRIANAQLGQLLEQSPAVLYILKLSGDIVVPHLVSENISHLLGFSVAESMNPDWWSDQLHPEDRERAVNSVAETICAGTSLTEYRIRHNDGHYLWVDDARRLIRNAAGEPVEVIGVLTDVTERRRAEEVVREASLLVSRNRNRKVLIELAIFCILTATIISIALWTHRFEGVSRWVLKRPFEDLDELILTPIIIAAGLAIFAFRRWREAETALTNHQQVRAAMELLHEELDRQVKQRTLELKKANQTLVAEGKIYQESEERFRQLAENIHEVFWITDSGKKHISYVSPAYEGIWGRTCASLYEAPDTWLGSIRPEDRERVRQAVLTKQTQGAYDEEYRILRPDGTERWIRDRAFPVRGANGSVIRCVGVAEDITESKRLQEQFYRGQRMEAIGTLAGGIAHDLNNILAPILMAPALLREYARSDQERRLLDLIEQSAQRGSHVVRQLLTFSRGSGGERMSVELFPLLNEMIAIMRETFPREIVIKESASRNLQSVVGDPTQLLQVIMNLCVNARDAMPEGGVLAVEARNVDLSAAELLTHSPAKPGPYVALSVTDSGEGIAPANLERIFDPFFTTKAPTKGTGLGLSTVLGIIRSHHGFVSVTSSLGRGTKFSIYLPAAPKAVGVAEQLPADAPPRGQGELILVVDDEEPICTATRLLLENHGYRVVTANEGAAALASFVENRGDVRLVLTDLMMPIMGGVTLIRALHLLDPDVKVLATSGLTDKENHLKIEDLGIDGIIEKPCDPNELLRTIREHLLRVKPAAMAEEKLEATVPA
jgi:PAS domain S-box-containing protein